MENKLKAQKEEMERQLLMSAQEILQQRIVSLYRNDPKFLDDRSGQTVQIQIRLLLEDQSDQGLHCLPFHLHLFDEIP